MNPESPTPGAKPATPELWQALLFTALAGGMAWGIRGQYGHETGAMIAGLLVGLVIVRLFAPGLALLPATRAVAFATLAMGFGGSMTYGQTVGLTHDADLVGNWEALRWGMLGLAIKGGLWIGFAGAFLGMGLLNRRYRPQEMLFLLMGLLALGALGEWLLNSPWDPVRRALPRIYFSASWHWRPELTPAQLKPRREVWGGLLVAFLALLAYTRGLHRDRLPLRLGLWGFLGGALGFPLGQSLQAWHAWNRAAFQSGPWAALEPHLNWWNLMETTFGAVMGATLGLGAWLNRERIGREIASFGAPSPAAGRSVIPPIFEIALLTLHLVLLAGVEFGTARVFNHLYDFGMALAWIPLVLVAGGRASVFLVVLPITLLPIAGKTYRAIVVQDQSLGPLAGGLLLVILPLLLASALAIRAGRAAREGAPAEPWLGRILLFATWAYWGLNWVFFHLPWPWSTWTTRTPNGILFTIAALGLTAFVLRRRTAASSTPGGFPERPRAT